MCLVLKENMNPQIATEDIVCYKFVVEYNPGELRTPYMDMAVEIGEMYTIPAGTMRPIKNIFNSIVVEVGFHSFVNYKQALLKACEKVDYGRLVRCIIPTGSTYYIGTFGIHSSESYASSSIKYVEIMDMTDSNVL